MSLDANLFAPLERGDGRRTAVEVYESLQDSILTGRLRPGTILSQVEVARIFSVSRTPVREAMRMLQEGGLVTSEPNFRSKVLGFDPKDIEALYIKRIMMESLAVTFTTRTMTPALKGRLDEVVRALEGSTAHQTFSIWLGLHREFHRLIVAHAGEAFANDLDALEKRSERYQSAYKGEHLPGWWQRGEKEHRALFMAISAGDAMQAGELSARHLARTALELLAALAPEYDTARLRTALQFALAGAAAGRL